MSRTGNRRSLVVALAVVSALWWAVSPAGAAGWSSQTVDGNGGSGGQLVGEMLGGTRASVWIAGELHTFYTDATQGNLRHAVKSGNVWHYETLDGAGGPHGRVDSWVGGDPTAIVYNGLPYVFYRDDDAGTLRMGTWGGDDWYFATLDGEGGPNGRVSASVGGHPSALVYAGLPYVFYDDGGNGNVRLATWGGTDWFFGVLDGAGGPNGRVDGSVDEPSAVLYGGLPYVFYTDSSSGEQIRMATWGGSDWFYMTLDGEGGPNGRVDEDVWGSSALISGGLPYVFYNADGSGIRMATWGGSDWFFGAVPVTGGPNQPAHPDAVDGETGPAFVYEEDSYAADLDFAWWNPGA